MELSEAPRQEPDMRFAISIPQFVSDGEFDPARFRAYMARAEALGFESAWTLEQTLGTMPFMSPLQTLSYAAACTERIRPGCVVFVTPLHSPVHLAKDLSTLDQLSRGRIEIGVGTGGRHRMFSAFQVDPTSLVARFNEGLRRAVKYGNGFFGAGSSTTKRFAEQVPIVRQALAEAGRDAASFKIGKRVYIAVDDDAHRARRRIGESLHRFYPFFELSGLEAVAIYGPPDACVRGLREVAEAGAELILLNPVFDEAEQMERLVAEVMPKLS